MKSFWAISLLFACLFQFALQSAEAARDPGLYKPFDPFLWEGDTQITTGSSPDNSHEIFISLIEKAEDSIYLEAYMLRSNTISLAIEDAAKRGVEVEILLDGWTVAKSKEEKIDQLELYYASKIVAAGGKVTYLKSDNFRREDRRFAYIHSKYAIFDEETVFIGSENFSNGGFNPTANAGNRGWVIAIQNPEVAQTYLNIFHKDSAPDSNYDDLAPYGSLPVYTLKDPNFIPDNPAKPGTYIPNPYRTVHGFASIERVTTPDDSMASNRAILGAINNATISLDIEALSFSPHWGTNDDTPDSNPSPLAEAVIEAARRGVKVRALVNPPIFAKKPGEPEKPEPPKNIIGMLASAWEDFALFSLPFSTNLALPPDDSKPENSRDNKFLIEYFRNLAKLEKLDLDVHFFRVSDTKLRALHNKGMIVDGESSLISSINWVENAMKNNREVGVIVKSPEVASYYNDIFELDWKYFRNTR